MLRPDPIDPQRAERPRQLQAEYETGLAQLGRRSLTFSRLMSPVGYAVLSALAGWSVWRSIFESTSLLGSLGLSSAGQALLNSLVASAVFLVIGLATAFAPKFRRL